MLKYKWMCVAVICCAMFAACEPTEVASDQNPISFNNGPARAQQVPASAANARIWAYYKTNENTTNWVWEGENAKLDIGTTTDDNGNFNGTFTVNGNTKYWDNGIYNFYSIYSEDFKGNGNIATYEGNKLTFTYSIANQNELRLATATDLKATNTHNEAVPFQFNHLLSKIKFQGFSTDATQEVTLKTITLSSVAHTAKYTIAADGAVSLTLSEDDTDIQPLSSTLTDQANWVMEKVVFPQTIGENQIEFKVTYDNNTSSEENIEKSAFLLPTTWSAGNSYLYKFYIQPSGPIIFDVVEVKPWIAGESSNILFDVP